MTSAPVEPPLSAGAVLRDRRMATFLFAATLSGIGMFLQAAALGKQIYDITDSTLAIGMLGLVEFTPALILLRSRARLPIASTAGSSSASG